MRITMTSPEAISGATLLHQRLRACLRGSDRLRTWLGLESCLTLALAGFVVLLIADALLVLPGWTRASVLLLGGSLGGLLAWNGWRKFRSPQAPLISFSRDEVQWLPVTLDDLRSGLAFAATDTNPRVFGSPRLQEAMIAQLAERLSWSMPWPYVRVRGWRRLARIGSLLVFLFAIGLAHPGTFPVALYRLALPLAHHPWNNIQRDSPAFGARGRPYPLRVTIYGWQVQRLSVAWDDGDERQEILVPVEWFADGTGRAEAELPVRGAFRYRLRARDFQSEGTVRMTDPPVLPPDTPGVEIVPPNYSGLPIQRLSQPGTMEALHGSQLRFHGHAPATVSRLWLTLENADEPVHPPWQAEVSLQSSTGAFNVILDTGNLVPGEWHCSFHLQNEEGLQTTYRYGLSLTTDPPPTVALHSAGNRDPLLVPPDGSLALQVVAEDKRYGLEVLHLLSTRQNDTVGPAKGALLHWLGQEMRRMAGHPFVLIGDTLLDGNSHFDVAGAWQRSLLCSCLSPDVFPVLPVTAWRMRPARWELTWHVPARVIEALGSGTSRWEAVAMDNSRRSTGVAWSQPLTVQVLSEQHWRLQRAAQFQLWLDRLHALLFWPETYVRVEKPSLTGDGGFEVLVAQQEWRRQVESLALDLSQQASALASPRSRGEVMEMCLFRRLQQVQQGLDHVAGSMDLKMTNGKLASRPEQLRRSCLEAIQELNRLKRLLSEAVLREQALVTIPEILGHLQQVEAGLVADGVAMEGSNPSWPALNRRLGAAYEAWTLLWHQGRAIVPAWPGIAQEKRIWAAWNDLHQSMNPPYRAKLLQTLVILERELQDLKVEFVRGELRQLDRELHASRKTLSWLRHVSSTRELPLGPALRVAWFLVPPSQPATSRLLEQALSTYQETKDGVGLTYGLETAMLFLQKETELQGVLSSGLQVALLKEQTARLDTELEHILQQWTASMRTLPEERLAPAAAWALRERQRQWSQGVERMSSVLTDQPTLAACLHHLTEHSREMETAWTESAVPSLRLQELRLAWERWRSLLSDEKQSDGLFAPYQPNGSGGRTTSIETMTGFPLRQTSADAVPRSLLPPRLRRALEQHAQERVPPHYAEECARYYRTLLEMHSTPKK